MPGRPIIRAQIKSLEERGEEAVFNMIAGGMTVVNTTAPLARASAPQKREGEDPTGRSEDTTAKFFGPLKMRLCKPSRCMK